MPPQVFEAQLSAQCSQEQKDAIADRLRRDQEYAQVFEADVIRLAILVGLQATDSWTPADCVRAYAQIRRGDPVGTA